MASTSEFRAPLIEVMIEHDRGSWGILAFAMQLGPKKDGMWEMPLSKDNTVPQFLMLKEAVAFAMEKCRNWVEWKMAETAVITYEDGNDYSIAAFYVDRTLAGGSNDPAVILKRFPQLAEQGYGVDIEKP